MAGMERRPATDAAGQPEHLLGLAVERAYTVFASNHLGSSMAVHRRDVTPDDVAALSGPVRSVTVGAVDRWLPHAITTWGTPSDLRALLPRVLELLTAGLLTTPPEVLFAKLRQAEAAGWPAAERAVLDETLRALWRTTLARHPSPIGLPAGRVLIALAELGDPLQPYLDDWVLLLTGGPGSQPARQHLLDLAHRINTLRGSGLAVADLFWSPHPEAAQVLDAWMSSPVASEELRP